MKISSLIQEIHKENDKIVEDILTEIFNERGVAKIICDYKILLEEDAEKDQYLLYRQKVSKRTLNYPEKPRISIDNIYILYPIMKYSQ